MKIFYKRSSWDLTSEKVRYFHENSIMNRDIIHHIIMTYPTFKFDFNRKSSLNIVGVEVKHWTFWLTKSNFIIAAWLIWCIVMIFLAVYSK